MRNKILFSLSVIGILAGLVSAFIFAMQKKPQPPVFNPPANPYAKGIYTNGITESYQTNGENINIYPEVPGTITKIMVDEGQTVRKGTPLIMIDDSVQRATVEQLKSQVEFAGASLKNVQDQLDKLKKSYELDPRSVSKNDLDNAENAVKVAKANLGVVQRQYELTKAGAWIYDIRNQEKQYDALSKAFTSANALLAKYTVRAPAEGIILSIKAAVGSYISPQGAYGTYTEGYNPVIVMGSSQTFIAVRCYIDEILIHRLPPASQMKAQMFIRGTNISIPLEFVRVQPYVSPKIELSNQRAERVDVRVLPVIFRFQKLKNIDLYPGQLVDVYIAEK